MIAVAAGGRAEVVGVLRLGSATKRETSRLETWLHWCRLRPTRWSRRGAFRFTYANPCEFEAIYDNLFGDQEYRFAATADQPFILDCGAHIGVSVLYFKSLYPRARIVAFEPNPGVFALLRENVRKNLLRDVTLVNAAVADAAGWIDFYAERRSRREWTWGGAGVANRWLEATASQTIQVPTVRLADYVDRPVDLLKLDVEGMEELAIRGCEGVLDQVAEIVMEFHGSSTNARNSLERTLDLLARHGFTYDMKQGETAVTEAEIERTDPYWLMIRAHRA